MGAGGSGEMTSGDQGSVERALEPLESTGSEDEATDLLAPSWVVSARIYAFSAVLALTAGVLWAVGPFMDAGPIRQLINEPEMLAVVGLLTALMAWQPVVFHYRGNSYTIVLGEVPLLLGLVFLPPRWFVLVTVLAEAIVYVFLTRKALIRVTFNLASVALTKVLTIIVFREVLGASSPVSLRGWGALAVAGCFLAISSTLIGKIVIKLNGQTVARGAPQQFTTEAMLVTASICLSFVVLDAAWFNLWATLPLLLVAILIVLAYRGYLRLLLRFGSLQRLYNFSRVLGSASLEPSSMSLEVLDEVCTVMRARRAQLILAEPSGIPRRISVGDGRTSRVVPVALDASSFVTQAIATGDASLHKSNAKDGSPGNDPIAGDYRDAIVAPIMSGPSAIGAIVALDRDEEEDHFDNDDLHLFGMLVAHASANLERARLVEELRYEVDSKSHQATHDMLTGLPNRMLFLTRAATALSESDGVAIVLLDIDRFKDVNDTLGHAIGDRLLCEVSERLLRAVSGRATVARLGGDEFAFVIADVADPASAVEIVHEVKGEISRPIKIDGLTLPVGASAGIALAPEHGDDVALLLQRAEIAMYLAKERRSAVEVYSVEQDQSMQRWLMLSGLLTHALEDKRELSVMYQPIANVKTGQIEQVEALARWNHPEQGAIPPDEFIGIAEQLGLIGQITDFVLAEGCARLAEWRRAGIQIGLAINCSGREFADASLVDRVAAQLQANNIPPDALTLEVTETEVVADLGQASRVLDELAGLGIRIAIDDYGTGYSSLAYIHRLPVQELKIDRSFVTNLPNDLSNAIIVRSSIAMAHSLGLTVVAEGAEDELTCAHLADADCDSIQGYYLSKPMEPARLQEWLLQGGSLAFTPSEIRIAPFGGQAAPGALASSS